MSTSDNIENNLNNQFKNHDYLPQKLFVEDLDGGALNFIKSCNITIPDGKGNSRRVPVIFLNQERWAEFKNNWEYLTDEGGTEISMPFITMRRISVKRGENPLKRFTIPNKKKFQYTRIEVFDGVTKGVEIYKVPQPPRIDIQYELRFFSHYMQNANTSYEVMLAKTFSDGYVYIDINGYKIPIELIDTAEDNTMEDITADRKFQIIYTLVLHGYIVDPNEFEKVQTITKIQVNMSESISFPKHTK